MTHFERPLLELATQKFEKCKIEIEATVLDKVEKI